jgi:hypothetical protein
VSSEVGSMALFLIGQAILLLADEFKTLLFIDKILFAGNIQKLLDSQTRSISQVLF